MPDFSDRGFFVHYIVSLFSIADLLSSTQTAQDFLCSVYKYSYFAIKASLTFVKVSEYEPSL